MKNLTPDHMRCPMGDCPSIHQLEDGRLLIVGKIAPFLEVDENGQGLHPEDWPVDLNNDETAIVISPDLLSDLFQTPVPPATELSGHQKTEYPERLRCVKCAKPMQNITDRGQQPLGGLAFSTRGHYGSAYFDPMDASYLEISICDKCVEEAERSGIVFRSTGTQVTAPESQGEFEPNDNPCQTHGHRRKVGTGL